MRRLVSLALVLAALSLHAADSAALLQRASRAFDAGEWASAQALYLHVTESEPSLPMPYGRAVFSSLMRADTTMTSELVERALKAHVPLDSVLSVVESEALAHAESTLYVDELHRLGRKMPYLRHPIEARLLKYYTFRSDAPMMIRYAKALLVGLPDAPQYLNALASAYLIEGDIDAAVAAWKRALGVDADNLDALVGLGNALYDSDPTAARQYLERAYQIHPTPYLQSKLSSKYELRSTK